MFVISFHMSFQYFEICDLINTVIKMWAILFLFVLLNHQSLSMTTVQWSVVTGLKFATYQQTLTKVTKETCLDTCTKVNSVILSSIGVQRHKWLLSQLPAILV